MRLAPTTLLLALTACGPPAWREARLAGTADAYEQFAVDYARYPQATAAMNRAEALRWARAEAVGSAAAWSAYLRTHHDAPRADEARKKLDEAAYAEALGDKDALALERYLATFPQGAHRKDARAHLDAVRWHEAKTEDSHLSYRRYLLQEADGEHRDEAATRYEERTWERTAKLDDLRGYQRYLEEFSDGPHAAEARDRIAKFQFTEVAVVVALGRSWQTDRKTALAALLKEAQAQLPKRFEAVGFKLVGAVTATDLGEGGDPAAVAPVAPGRGAVVLVVDDAQGEAFEPRGFATTMVGRITLHVADRPGALASFEVQGATSDRVRSIDEGGLYRSAATMLMGEAAAQTNRIVPWHPNPP